MSAGPICVKACSLSYPLRCNRALATDMGYKWEAAWKNFVIFLESSALLPESNSFSQVYKPNLMIYFLEMNWEMIRESPSKFDP